MLREAALAEFLPIDSLRQKHFEATVKYEVTLDHRSFRRMLPPRPLTFHGYLLQAGLSKKARLMAGLPLLTSFLKATC